MTPELATLLERLAASRGYLTEADAFKAAGLLPDLARRLAEAEARMDALKIQRDELLKDKERLDWLEEVGFATRRQELADPQAIVHKWGPTPAGEWGWTAHWVSSEFKSAREAIDGARAAFPTSPHTCLQCGKPTGSGFWCGCAGLVEVGES